MEKDKIPVVKIHRKRRLSSTNASEEKEERKGRSARDEKDPSSSKRGSCISVSRYEKVGRVGEGTYGVVYQARDRTTKEYVALKRCIPHNEGSDGFPVTTLREIASLRLCIGHPSIVQLLQVAVSDGGVFLVLEYCQTDLAEWVDAVYRQHRRSPFGDAACKTLIQQLLQALEHVHLHSLIHRDIKLSNLLYSRGRLKLADFGLSRVYSSAGTSNLTLTVASLWYRAPELMWGQSSSYNQTIDTWAAGCVFAELLRGCPLAAGKDEDDQTEKLLECVGLPMILDSEKWPRLDEYLARNPSTKRRRRRTILLDYAFLSDAGLDLLLGLLAHDPKDRWTATAALAAKYFRDSPAVLSPDRMPRVPPTASS